MDFSDVMMLHSRPNSCCQQNPKCFDMSLLSLESFPINCVMPICPPAQVELDEQEK